MYQMNKMNKMKKSRNEMFTMFADQGCRVDGIIHGIRERHGWVKHCLRMLVAYKLVRGPQPLYAPLAAHAHTMHLEHF
jgi:hypothetical protein